MASDPTGKSELDYADTLWKAADALRGQVDAAEYKHVVLGLLFLKYVSDSFESRRAAMDRESQSLSLMRDHLLPNLLSGAVRVGGVQRLAGEVA